MRLWREKKKTSASASARASNAPIGRASSVLFRRRNFCEWRWKDIWKASGSSGCDFGSRNDFRRRSSRAGTNSNALLAQLESRPDRRLKPGEAERLQELYAQTAADLNRVIHGALAPDLRQYLERLVARAYAELYYAPPTRSELWQPRRWLRIFTAFPEAFRRQSRYFALAVLITILGCAFGGLAVRYDPASVDVLLPADYLRNPGLRVQQEEKGQNRHLDSAQIEAQFSAQLITHNIQVALLAAALGVTFGIGTALLLFENGVLLGAVAVHYTQQGFGLFVTAWLLPHGAFEIPSILIAGQAGFYLGALAAAAARGPQYASIHARMVAAGRGAGDDAGLGRNDGGVFFAASGSGAAVWIQGRGWRGGAGAARHLPAADRAKRRPARNALKTCLRRVNEDFSAKPFASTIAELTIATPEGVLFRLPLAGPAARLYAMLLDIAIVLAAMNGLGYLVYWIFAKAPGFASHDHHPRGIRHRVCLWRIAGRFLEWADDRETPIPFTCN